MVAQMRCCWLARCWQLAPAALVGIRGQRQRGVGSLHRRKVAGGRCHGHRRLAAVVVDPPRGRQPRAVHHGGDGVAPPSAARRVEADRRTAERRMADQAAAEAAEAAAAIAAAADQ
jgi:hypothetical protein